MGPVPPIPVVTYKLGKLIIPFLHPTRLEMLPQKTGRPENAGIESIQFRAATGCVEPAETVNLGAVVVSRILLDVLELEELDITVEENVPERVSPDYSEGLQ